MQEHLQDSDSISSISGPAAAATAEMVEVGVASASSSSAMGTVDRSRPDFDRLKDESVPLAMFHDWPERAARIVEPRDLAKAGMFYTGQTDRVQCAFCRGCLYSWEHGDIPAEEHRRHFPDCPFVKKLEDVPRDPRTCSSSECVCRFQSYA